MSKKSVDVMDGMVDKKLNDLELINLKDLKLFYNYKLDQSDCLNENSDNMFDLYEIFQIIDRGNNDIGTNVLADITALNRNLYTDFSNEVSIKDSLNPLGSNPFSKLLNTTVNTLFSDLASKSGFNFYQIPNYLNLSSVLTNSNNDDDVVEMVDHLFGVHTDTGLFGDFSETNNKSKTFYGGLSGFPGYIFQIGSSPSTLNQYSFDEKIKNNFNSSFCLDLITDKNGQIYVSNEDAPDDIKNSNVTSFIVDFGQQNQQMFNSIELDSAEFAFTEHSITTWTDLVNSNSNRALTTNMFPIYEKYMYTCKVSGLGNATIQPLTYFYLKNTPMFYGTYWITNVSHNITPNNMSTTFQGVRQPIATKNDTRLVLLELYTQAAALLSGATQEANTIITDGVQPTSGPIKKNVSSDKPFKEYLQKNQNQLGNSIFDGKTLLGAYIYSITQSRDKTPSNLAILATLYNLSKSYTKTENHAEILANMTNIAIANMIALCRNGDLRYDDGNKGLSLYKLFKVSGNGFSTNSPLNTVLDDICKSELEYKTILKLTNINNYSINIKPNIVANGHKEYYLEVGEQMNTSNIDLSGITMFIDNNARKYLDDRAPALGEYVMFNLLENKTSLTNKDTLNYRKLVKTSELSNKNSINSDTNIGVKYVGTFDNTTVFFSTTVNEKIGVNIDLYPEYKLHVDLLKANNSDLNEIPKVRNGYGNLKNNYTTNVVIRLEDEWLKWNNNNQVLKESDCNNKIVRELLETYWSSTPGGLQYYKTQGGCSGIFNQDTNMMAQAPWSAAFISYIMAHSGVKEFPYSSKHSTYIQKARNNTNNGGNYSWYGYEAKNSEAYVEIGDLLCYTRGKTKATTWDNIIDGTNTHCDCVTRIDNTNPAAPIAEVIGGNVSNTVKKSYVNLTSDFKIKLTGDQSNYKGVLKYKPQEVDVKSTVLNFGGTIADLVKLAGYEPKSAIGVMAIAIATREGYNNKKTSAYINNNPGNLDYSKGFKTIDSNVYQEQGNTEQTSRFAVFSDATLGMKALIETKIKKWSYGNMPETISNGGLYAKKIGEWKKGQPPTFEQFFYTYAPPTDSNATDSYINYVVTTINTNTNNTYTPKTLVKTIFG
jgi:hypothetical protein